MEHRHLAGAGVSIALTAAAAGFCSSDWPHWDFDLPARVADLPFLSEHAKHNILGDNARRLFHLPKEGSRGRQQDSIP